MTYLSAILEKRAAALKAKDPSISKESVKVKLIQAGVLTKQGKDKKLNIG